MRKASDGKFKIFDTLNNKMIFSHEHEKYDEHTINNREDYKILRSSGKKDKNGKLIYEKDVVENDYGFWIVTFLEELNELVMLDTQGNSCEFTEKDKVIGNLWKHPGMLDILIRKQR
jgi:uncharacterized phage protein (TIGR01671 family)